MALIDRSDDDILDDLTSTSPSETISGSTSMLTSTSLLESTIMPTSTTLPELTSSPVSTTLPVTNAVLVLSTYWSAGIYGDTPVPLVVDFNGIINDQKL